MKAPPHQEDIFPCPGDPSFPQKTVKGLLRSLEIYYAASWSPASPNHSQSQSTRDFSPETLTWAAPLALPPLSPDGQPPYYSSSSISVMVSGNVPT